MGTTTYSITWAALLALDRRVESPSTQTIATLATSEQTAVATDLNPKLGTGNTMGTYAQSTYVATQQSVSWTSAPSLNGVTTNTATISLTSDNDYGEVACVALADGTYSNNQKPTATQVFLGLTGTTLPQSLPRKLQPLPPLMVKPQRQLRSHLMVLQRVHNIKFSVPPLTDLLLSQALLHMPQMITIWQWSQRHLERLKKTPTMTSLYLHQAT